MNVAAKFFIQTITTAQGYETVKLAAATRGARNTEWSKYTPSGSIEMTITNPEASRFFRRLLEREGQHPEVDVVFSVSADAGDHPFVASPEGHYNAGSCAACGAKAEVHKAVA